MDGHARIPIGLIDAFLKETNASRPIIHEDYLSPTAVERPGRLNVGVFDGDKQVGFSIADLPEGNRPTFIRDERGNRVRIHKYTANHSIYVQPEHRDGSNAFEMVQTIRDETQRQGGTHMLFTSMTPHGQKVFLRLKSLADAHGGDKYWVQRRTLLQRLFRRWPDGVVELDSHRR